MTAARLQIRKKKQKEEKRKHTFVDERGPNNEIREVPRKDELS